VRFILITVNYHLLRKQVQRNAWHIPLPKNWTFDLENETPFITYTLGQKIGKPNNFNFGEQAKPRT
jgi:hypothetical protein